MNTILLFLLGAVLGFCITWALLSVLERRTSKTEDKPITGYRVSWYCSMFVGAPHWHGTEIYEPDECETDFETVVSKEDWNAKVASVRCPSCRSLLTQNDDAPEIVEVLYG